MALFGSPIFAVPTLESLARQHHLVLVVTQPDKPAGRGLNVRSPAVAQRARELGVPLAQPAAIKRNDEFASQLRELDLDVAVTAAYGRILPASLLEIPRHGFLNVHASLLPKYRGAAPVQWALIRAETETGITIMQTDVGLDTGAIRLQRRVRIGEGDDARTLLSSLAVLGAETLAEALTLLAEGTLPLTPQDDASATLAPPLTPADGVVRWQDSAEEVVARHRGVALWPGSSFEFATEHVKVEALRKFEPVSAVGADAATVLQLTADGVVVACGSGAVELLTVKPAGKRAMSARSWANGRRVKTGVQLV